VGKATSAGDPTLAQVNFVGTYDILHGPQWGGIIVPIDDILKMQRQKMDRPAILMAIAAVLASTGPAFSQALPATSDALIIQVKDHAELNEKWCAANPNIEHIFVLPASLFVDSRQLICDSGPYKLYRIVEHDDEDDFEYFIDPPSYGRENRLGCDGKAGLTMQTVAVNCRPLK
jgi:hypothetical protein